VAEELERGNEEQRLVFWGSSSGAILALLPGAASTSRLMPPAEQLSHGEIDSWAKNMAEVCGKGEGSCSSITS